jgi:CheY-like chemotaxis protein
MIRLGRVLLVDGSAVFRETFAAVLEPHAEEVTVAGDCESAVRLLEERALPDLLLCEIALPDGDGFEVLDHVAQAPHATAPASILLTSAWSRRAAEQARAMGAIAVLAKPLGFRDLAMVWKQHRSGEWKEVQRAHTRPLGVSFVLDPADEDRPVLCWPLVNLGIHDALVDAGGPIPVGTMLTLNLHVGEQRCRVESEVVRIHDPAWDHSPGVAIRFSEPSEALRELVASSQE